MYTFAVFEEEVKNKMISSFNVYDETLMGKRIQFNSDQIYRDYLSFLNASFGDYLDNTIKSLIISEVWKLEHFSVGLGDDLLNLIVKYFKKYDYATYSKADCERIFSSFLKSKKIKENGVRFKKEHLKKYVSGMKYQKSKNICNILIDTLSPGESVYLEKTNREKTVIRKSDSYFFNISFDKDFLLKKNSVSLPEYNVVLIDGFIDSVGEIHHLLQKASETKEKYVIFCKGMRDDVKHTILLNLQRNTINLYPISLDIDEENVNILSDIASILGTDTISSTKGDTISIALRKDMPVRKNIEICQNGIYLEKNLNNSTDIQLQYLKSKISKLQDHDPNVGFIKKRIKNLTSKKTSIELSSNIEQNTIFEIDGFLKFLSHGKSGIFTGNCKKGKSIYSCTELAVLFDNLKSVIKTICNIGCIVYQDKNER